MPGDVSVSPHRVRIATIVVVLYVALRTVVAATSQPAIYPDSVRYWVPEEPMSVFIGWTGSMAPSLLPQVLFLLPFPAPFVVQGLLGGVAWGFAAWTALVGSRMRPLGYAVGLTVMALGLLPYNAGFDSSVLSESLSISASLLCLTFVFHMVSPQARADSGVTIGACAVLAAASFVVGVLARPSGALVVLPAMGVAFLFSRKGLRPRVAGIALSAVLAASFWGVAAAKHEADRAGWYTAANRLSARVSPAYLDQARAAGLPHCHGLGDRLLRTPELSDRLRLVKSLPCPELMPWLEAGGLPVTRQIVALPGETFAAWWEEHYLQWQPVIFPEMDYPLIVWPEFAGVELFVVNRWYYQFYVTLLVLVGLLSASAVVGGRWVPRLRGRGVRSTAITYLVFVATTVAYSFATWVVDTYETRHFLPVQAVGAVVALIVALNLLRDLIGGQRATREPSDT